MAAEILATRSTLVLLRDLIAGDRDPDHFQ
jgi:hypothetical protein